jgi:hypothetical protein
MIYKNDNLKRSCQKNQLQYKDDGKLDWKTHSILRKVHFRELFEYDDFVHMKSMNDDRKDKLLEYIELCLA